MEKNTKILIATVSLLAVGFLMWSKAKAAPAKASSPIKSDDKNKPEAAVETVQTPKYPMAVVLSSSQTGLVPTGEKIQLKEGDYIKGVSETAYVLRDGKKYPVTEKWWVFHNGDDYSSIIQLSDTTVNVIPTGNILDI